MHKWILAFCATAPWVGLALAPQASAPDALVFEKRHGYLVSLLKSLKINPDSQVLVFSKSSLQADFIGRKTPRALYFNETTYVGWIPGAPVIEIMTVDPVLGAKFTVLPNLEPAKKPTFMVEGPRCFRCHGGGSGPASLFVQSSHVPESGYPRAFVRSHEVTPSTPISQRWGGWYVTGTHGTMRHMGNVASTGTDENPKLDTAKGANITNLAKFVDLKRYLTPHSDIVALMVMEQQMHVQNLISQTGADLKGRRRVNPNDVEHLVRALLGSEEAPLTAPVRGTSGFAARYAGQFPKDKSGRSLGQLDLVSRLQKYPCSPLIYSESFAALPDPVRAQVWKRFREILLENDATSSFRHLKKADRDAIRQILVDTVPECRDYLTSSSSLEGSG